MFEDLDKFKIEIIDFVKLVYSLILEDYKEYLSDEKRCMIENFDYSNNIKIDKGGKYTNSPGRWESKTGTLALSPESFYNTVYKKEVEKEVPLIDIEEVLRKLKDSSNEVFTGLELIN